MFPCHHGCKGNKEMVFSVIKLRKLRLMMRLRIEGDGDMIRSADCIRVKYIFYSHFSEGP